MCLFNQQTRAPDRTPDFLDRRRLPARLLAPNSHAVPPSSSESPYLYLSSLGDPFKQLHFVAGTVSYL